jgi:hypothetical protein
VTIGRKHLLSTDGRVKMVLVNAGKRELRYRTAWDRRLREDLRSRSRDVSLHL